jgi:hypothetical protein
MKRVNVPAHHDRLMCTRRRNGSMVTLCSLILHPDAMFVSGTLKPKVKSSLCYI